MRSARRALVRAAPWVAVLVPLVEVVVVVGAGLPLATTLAVAVVAEVALGALLVAEAVRSRREWQAARREGAPLRTALSRAVLAGAPPPLLALARFERGTWRGLWWAVRRRRAVGPGETPFGYTSRIGVMLWVTIALTPVEMGAVHLLLPWAGARLALLVLSAVSTVWLVGFALGLRQRPHVLGPDALVVRFGHLRELVVPRDAVLTARARTTLDHRRTLEVEHGQLALSVLGESSVAVGLRPGSVVELDGRPVDADQVVFFADDPRAVVGALRSRQGSDR